MNGRIVIAACIALLGSRETAEAARPLACKIQRSAHTGWTVSPSLGCRELVEAMKETLAQVVPPAAVALHVWLEDVSTAGTIGFEARALAVESGGQLRHTVRAKASAREPSRATERSTRLIARSALDRALRDLISAIGVPRQRTLSKNG